MRARTLAERHTLALQISQRLDRRILRHDDRLGVAVRFHRGSVADPGAAGLREARRGVADIAEVDTPDIDGLEQRRPELEVDPLDLDAERLEGILQRLALAHRREEPALLRADADFGGLVFSARRRSEGGRKQK